MKRYFYAEVTAICQEDIYAGGYLAHRKGEPVTYDLFRFPSKQERDEFVTIAEQDPTTVTISLTAKEARREHKDQFRYWEACY